MAARVLVIEDDLISQDIIKSGLEAHGFEVDVAGDGFSAVRLLKEGRHGVALVDYQLPELDGYASARLLRELTDSGATECRRSLRGRAQQAPGAALAGADDRDLAQRSTPQEADRRSGQTVARARAFAAPASDSDPGADTRTGADAGRLL